MDGYRRPATRTLYYQSGATGQADVYFDHGGFFHELDSATADGQHPLS